LEGEPVESRNQIGSLVLSALGILAVAQAHATTFVDADATALARRSQVVVYGRVLAVEAVADPSSQGVWTNITIQVDTVVGGALPQASIVVRELGGELGDYSEHILGAASYAPGERVLAFLQERPDGTHATTDMALGKFEVTADSNGNRTATRRLEEGVALFEPSQRRLQPAPGPTTYPFDDLVAQAQLVFRAAGLPVRTPGALDPDEPVESQAPFVLMGHARWFEPDTNQPVNFLIDENGSPRLGPAVSRAAIDEALGVWTTVPSTPLVLADGGPTVPRAFAGCDGPNRVIFNDPFNEVANASGCAGVLAIGGYCTSGESTVHNGVTFRRIVRGKVTFNDGWEACGLWTACQLAEVATHELGHTIGLGHSSKSAATMAPNAHFDGRCAGLMADDIAGANFIYGEPTTDLVILPRHALRIVIPPQGLATAKLTVVVRNVDPPGTGVTRTAQLIASDGDCPVGTVGTPDFDRSTPAAQDSAPVRPGASRTAIVPVTFTSSAVNTPNANAPQRCTVHLKVEAVGSGSDDETPDNNVLDVPIDVFDPSDDSGDTGRQLQETVLDALPPVHIRLRKGAGNTVARLRFTLRNLDVGTFPSHTVQMSTSDGDCPPGTTAGITLPDNLSTVSIPQAQKRHGRMSIRIDAGTFATRSAQSPTRCTARLAVQPLPGEGNISNNTVPLVIDVVDSNDY
jgi:hypothetical protein